MLTKYIFDTFFALLGLIIVAPVLLIISLLIKIKMPHGPVIFTQNRVGKNGKLFTLYKFRTMETANYSSSVSVKGESRITKLGQTLRQYKLDELPELWNVLKGDMSFVGPRPDVPGFADNLTGDDRKILEVRPGITGPATLKYANEEELLAEVEDPERYNSEVIFPDKVRINKEYIEQWSIWKDIEILVRTFIR